jgi:Tfp pilus assembly protein PilV
MHLSLPRPSRRGTSLIEAMAALVVFSVGILGVMQMNVLASQQNNLARSQTSASRIARDVADSFERLPFNHPAINATTTLLQEDTEFSNMDNGDGLVKLQDAVVTQAGIRPMFGSADAIFASEGESNFYQVAWRALQIPNPKRGNDVDQIRILVMVRFPTPGGGLRQVNTWAIKTSPELVTGDPDTNMEF